MIIWYWSVKGGVGTSVVAAATAIRLASGDHDTTLVDLAGDQPSLLGMIASMAPSEPGIGDWVAAGEGVAADAIGRLLEDVAPGLRLLRQGTVPLAGAERPRVGPRVGPRPGGEEPVAAPDFNSERPPPPTEPDVEHPGAGPAPGSGRRRLMLALEVLARSGPVVVDAGLDRGELRSDLGAGHRPVCVLRACYLALSRTQQVTGPYDRVVLVEEPGRALRSRDVAAAVGASQVERVAWDPRVARSVDAGTIVSMLPPPLRRFELPT